MRACAGRGRPRRRRRWPACAAPRPGAVVEQAVAHQTQLAGPVVGVDDVTVGVDHDDAHRRQRHDVLRASADTVMPDCSTARRCLRSASCGARPAPDRRHRSPARAVPRLRSAAVRIPHSRANAYASGERHPSSVRPNRDMSHAANTGVRAPFIQCSPSVSPPVRSDYLAPWLATAAAPAAAASGSR